MCIRDRSAGFVGPLTGNVTGTIQTAAQTNITSVGTLSGLTVTNPIAGSVTGTAATVTGAAQTNITSLGTLTGLSVNANTLTLNGTDPLISLQNGGSNHWQLGFENTQSDRFVIYDNNASSYRLIIDSSGNTTLAGSVTATGVTVGNTTIGSNTSHFPNLTINNNGYIGSVNATTAVQIATGGGVTLSSTLTGTTASFSTASTSASVFTLTDTGVAAYEVTFPDTGTYQLGTNTTSTKTFKLVNAGSGQFEMETEGTIFSNSPAEMGYEWQRTGVGKKWSLGSDANGTYFYNNTDAVLPIFIKNDGNIGINLSLIHI